MKVSENLLKTFVKRDVEIWDIANADYIDQIKKSFRNIYKLIFTSILDF